MLNSSRRCSCQFAGCPANHILQHLLYAIKWENQDDNAGNHEEMFFLCTCVLPRRKPVFCTNLQLAGQGNARSMPGWRMWSADHARLDNTSWQQKKAAQSRLIRMHLISEGESGIAGEAIRRRKSESSEPYDSELKHLRGDSNPCFSLERAAC